MYRHRVFTDISSNQIPRAARADGAGQGRGARPGWCANQIDANHGLVHSMQLLMCTTIYCVNLLGRADVVTLLLRAGPMSTSNVTGA